MPVFREEWNEGFKNEAAKRGKSVERPWIRWGIRKVVEDIQNDPQRGNTFKLRQMWRDIQGYIHTEPSKQELTYALQSSEVVECWSERNNVWLIK